MRAITENRTIILSFVVYLVLLTTSYYFKTDLIKFLANTYVVLTQIILFSYLLRNLTFLNKIDVFLFSALTSLILAGYIVNYGVFDLEVSLKYFGMPLYYCSGVVASRKAKLATSYLDVIPAHIYILLLLPIIVYVLDIVFFGDTFVVEGRSVSIFWNRNSTVFYSVVASFSILLSIKLRRFFLGYIIIVVVLYNTIGAFIGLGLAFIIQSVRRYKIKSLLYLVIITSIIVIVGKAGIYYKVPIVTRAYGMFQNLQYVSTSSSITSIEKTNYLDLMAKTESTETSFLFRIKHWAEIIRMYTNSNIEQKFFGLGIESIKKHLSREIRAHNDYLRTFAELGPIYFLFFLYFNFLAIKRIAHSMAFFPSVIVLFYYFTENLIDNFIAISMFYYFLGLFSEFTPYWAELPGQVRPITLNISRPFNLPSSNN